MSIILSESTVGVLVPVQDKMGKFVIGYGKNISVLSWDGRSKGYKIEHKFKVDDAKIGNRFNDGKADVKGRLWIGKFSHIYFLSKGSVHTFIFPGCISSCLMLALAVACIFL